MHPLHPWFVGHPLARRGSAPPRRYEPGSDRARRPDSLELDSSDVRNGGQRSPVKARAAPLLLVYNRFVAKAVGSLLRGHDYQGRFFWTQAARLRMRGTPLERVGYECGVLKGFDDVVVTYHTPRQDEFFEPVDEDHYQLKFRVAGEKPFTWEALMDPGFIGATKNSLLANLKAAVEQQSSRPRRVRLTIVSPTPVEGLLAKIVSNDAGAILFDRLYRGTRTDEAAVRRAWRNSLDLASDEDLRSILAPLRIRSDFPTLEGLREELDYRLACAGLVPWDGTERATKYDDLPKKLSQSGVGLLSAGQLDEILRRENLIVGPPYDARPTGRRYGIRSYMRWAERMVDRTDEMLCLVRYFNERRIRDAAFWNQEIAPALRSFLERVIARESAEVHLDTHTSIAVAAGWFLAKAPREVVPVQGQDAWKPENASPQAPLWLTPDVVQHGDGADVALVLSVSHSAWNDALEYIREHVRNIGRIVGLTIDPCPSRQSVRDGTHAYQLAESAVQTVAAAMPTRTSTVHLFIAAPNGLAFFVGRLAGFLGRLTLYEHDFTRQQPVPYERSLALGG